jgi:hypothetical protein
LSRCLPGELEHPFIKNNTNDKQLATNEVYPGLKLLSTYKKNTKKQKIQKKPGNTKKTQKMLKKT